MSAATVIRPATPDDALSLWQLKRALGVESRFLRLSPAEELMSVADYAAALGGGAAGASRLVIVGEIDGDLVACLEAELADPAGVVTKVRVGVLSTCSDMGVGGALLAEMERWALDRRAVRIEITVTAENTRALSMYERRGYAIESQGDGVIHGSDEIAPEYHMAKALGVPAAI